MRPLGLTTALGSTALLAVQEPSPNNDQTSTGSCCETVKAAGISNILYPDTVAYENRTISYWSVSSQLTPWCIVQPVSVQQVATAITTLTQNTSCQFAVRSGGHMTWAGSNNIINGVTLDLGLMNATIYNPETQVASIQPGSIWQGVYETLDPWNVTVPGGRAASVGVAGFLAGGGNSFYGARKGFACDNVVNFEVVLASGEVINANASDNADLFQALKGGQSNFGVITRFDMQAFDAPPLWGGVVQYNKTTGPQQIDAYVSWTANLNNFTQGSAIMFWTYQPALKDIIIIDAFDDTTGAVAASGFDQFLAIPNNLSSSLRVASHLELTVELAQPAGYRDIWFTATIRNNKLVYEKIIQLHEQLCDTMAAQSPDGDFITQAMFQSIPTVFSQHSVEKGGNVLGLDRETENVVMLLFTLAVKGLDQEAVAQKQMRLFADATVAYADSLNSLVEWQYINYANDWQDPLGSYGAENIAKIKAAAAKFDPAGIFQTRAPGGFKISKTSDSKTT